MCNKRTVVYFCYERRWAGDKGKSFFEIAKNIFEISDPVPSSELHPDFSDEYIDMLLMTLR